MQNQMLFEDLAGTRGIDPGEKTHQVVLASVPDLGAHRGTGHEHAMRGQRTIIVYGRHGSSFALLDHLTDVQISEKLPVHLRHLPLAEAA